MNSAIDHNCPNCDAILKFNPHGQNWKCEYCKGEFNLDQITSNIEKKGKKLEENISLKEELKTSILVTQNHR